MRRFLLILVLLIVAGGAVWYFVIKPKQTNTSGTSSGFRSFFSLGGGNLNTLEGDVSAAADDTAITDTPPNSPYTRISVGPVAGYTTYTVTKTITLPSTDPKQKPVQQTITQHVIRYVSRANGYVYEVIDGGIPTQITNIFIPNIYEAYFTNSNHSAVLRFLRDDGSTIATYVVPIPEPNPDGTRTQQDGIYLADNIQSLAVSPDQKTLLRLTTDANSATITTSDNAGGNIKTVLQSPFHEWLLSWANQQYAQTKASASANGFLYRIDGVNKRLIRIIGSTAGLTTSVSPKGTYVLYATSVSSSFTAKLFKTNTGTIKDINLAILPEKCVWLATEDAICAGSASVVPATYPDDWYKGTTSFSDTVYKIYPGSGLIDTVGEPSAYDMTNLQYDESRNYLYFIDKRSGLLWQYAL